MHRILQPCEQLQVYKESFAAASHLPFFSIYRQGDLTALTHTPTVVVEIKGNKVPTLRELVVARHGVAFDTIKVVMKLGGRSLKTNAVLKLRASEPTPKNLAKFDTILIRLASLLLCSVS